MSVRSRLVKIEKNLQGRGWRWHLEMLVKTGQATRYEVLDEVGSLALETWPQWFGPEDRERADEADRRFDEEMKAELGEEKYQALLENLFNNGGEFPNDLF